MDGSLDKRLLAAPWMHTAHHFAGHLDLSRLSRFWKFLLVEILLLKAE